MRKTEFLDGKKNLSKTNISKIKVSLELVSWGQSNFLAKCQAHVLEGFHLALTDRLNYTNDTSFNFSVGDGLYVK